MEKNKTPQFLLQQRNQVDIINIIKSVSLLSVILGHFAVIYGTKEINRGAYDNNIIKLLLFDTLYAVDAFLWISGYLFSLKGTHYLIRNHPLKLLFFRIIRIYPLFLIIFLFYAYNNETCLANINDLVFLISNLTNKFGCFEWIWYIEIEIQIFTFLILIITFTRQQYLNKLLYIILICLVILTTYDCIKNNYSISYYSLMDGQYYFHHYQKPYFRAAPFLIGYLTQNISMNKLNVIIGLLLLIFLLIGWYPIIENQYIFGQIFNNIFQSLSRPLLGISLTLIVNPLKYYKFTKILQNVANRISQLSFSIYLIHYQIMIKLSTFDFYYGLKMEFILSLSLIFIISNFINKYIENNILLGIQQLKKWLFIQSQTQK